MNKLQSSDKRLRLCLPDIEKALGCPLSSINPLTPGANSAIYKIDTEQGSFVVKFYLSGRGSWDRYTTEFNSLSYLTRFKELAIAHPYFGDQRQGFAIYRFIEGKKVPQNKILPSHIAQFIGFFQQLQKISGTTPTNEFRPACEAYFSLTDHCQHIEQRLANLEKTPHTAVHEFHSNQLIPWWNQLKTRIGQLPPSINSELPQAARILSPSDIGFHNSLLDNDGRLHFVDFEYFGWDDPAKLLSDFLLQPQYNLTDAQQRSVYQEVTSQLTLDSQFQYRFPVMLELMNFKWCLIYLNPALPERQNLYPNDKLAHILNTQISKAIKKINDFEQLKSNVEFYQWQI